MQIKFLRILVIASCFILAQSAITHAQDVSSVTQPTAQSKDDAKRAEQSKKDAERLAKIRAKEEAERQEQVAKDEKRRAKQAEKERAERPAQVTINASAERIRSLIVARAATHGTTIEEETNHKIVFSKRITGMKGAFTQALIGNAYSEQPKYTATLVLVEIEKGKTQLTLSDAAITVRMAFGNVNRVDYTNDKKTKAEVETMFLQVKQIAETQEQEAAKQTQTVAQTVAAQPQAVKSVLSAEGYNQAGVGLFQQKKYSEAEIAFREAVKLDAYNAAYHHNLGTALNAQNKFDDAEKEIELATRLAPNEEAYKKSLEVVRLNKSTPTLSKAN